MAMMKMMMIMTNRGGILSWSTASAKKKSFCLRRSNHAKKEDDEIKLHVEVLKEVSSIKTEKIEK